MQLSELLFQKVKELGAQGSLALKPGYVAIVSRTRAIRAALTAALFPGPDDQRLLSDGAGPTRVGVGLLGADGQQYRLLRELGGGRQLQRFDAAAKKFLPLSEDDLEIASFLRVECQLPTPEAYANFFVLAAGELPSLRTATPPSPAALSIDQERVKQLKAELEQTRKFEEAQDQLYKVTERLRELEEAHGQLEAAERDFKALDEQASRSLFTPAQVKDLSSRAQRFAAEGKKYQETMSDLANQRQKLSEEVPAAPEPLFADLKFWGGIAGGIAIDALAFVFKHPSIAFLGLVPFAVPLVLALRWVDAHEAEGQSAGLARRLKEREDQLKKAHAEEQAPLLKAMKTAEVKSPEELLELFKSRDEVVKLRDAARERLEQLQLDPKQVAVAMDRPKLLEDKQTFEATVAAQGFARPVGEIEKDLKKELGGGGEAAKKMTLPGHNDAEVGRLFTERAAELLGMSPVDLWAQIGQRFAAYLTALSDKRLVGGKLDGQTLVLSAADGRSGPYHTLPQPLRDQAYAALRLVLLERVVAVKKMPVMIDDTFAPLDPAKRPLLHKMLKALAAQTQVLHRTADEPPPGIADHVVKGP